MDGIWGAGWSPDGDVDDANGRPAPHGGLGELANRPKGLVSTIGGLMPVDRPVKLSETVAANVRLEAARVGVTQGDLARELGLSRSAVSLRYTHRVAWRIDELERVAWYLNLPVTDLFAPPEARRRRTTFF